MPRTKVDTIAAAVVRRLQARGGPAAPRRSGPPRVEPSIDRLADTLASAVTRRLASGRATPGIPLSASRLTRGIVRTVTRQLGTSPGAAPVALSTIDPAAAAKALTGALGARQATTDPAAIVASTILRRLNSVRLVGTPAEARAFQGRVASIVTASLRIAQAEAPAEASPEATPEATAAVPEQPAPVPVSAPAAPAEAPATARKRD